MAGLGIIFHPMVLLELLCLILVTSIAFNGMMFLLMVRVDDPLVPRAMFGVLNTLLVLSLGRHVSHRRLSRPGFAPSPSLIPSPIAFTASKPSCSKTAALRPSNSTCFFLFVFGIGTLLIATPLFKRTL